MIGNGNGAPPSHFAFKIKPVTIIIIHRRHRITSNNHARTHRRSSSPTHIIGLWVRTLCQCPGTGKLLGCVTMMLAGRPSDAAAAAPAADK